MEENGSSPRIEEAGRSNTAENEAYLFSIVGLHYGWTKVACSSYDRILKISTPGVTTNLRCLRTGFEQVLTNTARASCFMPGYLCLESWGIAQIDLVIPR